MPPAHALTHLRRLEGVQEVLLVRENQQRRGDQFFLAEELAQLVRGFLHALLVGAVNDVH